MSARDRTVQIRHTIEGCLETAIGTFGLPAMALEQTLAEMVPHFARLKGEIEAGRLPFLTVARETRDIEEAAAAFARLGAGARRIVFFGTGGSSLGGQTLAALAPPAPQQRGLPELCFQDNLDPVALEDLLATSDLAATRFILVSKSGGTAETLAQAMAAITKVSGVLGVEAVGRQFLGLTEPAAPGKKNGLRSLCGHFGIPILDHHPGIGGRFSCLSNVGLLPVLAAGLDPYEVRTGAREIVEDLFAAERPSAFAPALGAALAVALARERSIRTVVLMPYAGRLERLAAWFVQLWAESLGKNGGGTSPIAALGPRDQHSQLQLFMEGPREIYITLVRTDTAGSGPVADPALAALAGAEYMAGRAVGDIVAAQGVAMARALISAGRPVRTLDVGVLNERVLGALLTHLMVETVLAGWLEGADPFDQPGVELAKKLTRERLGHTAG